MYGVKDGELDAISLTLAAIVFFLFCFFQDDCTLSVFTLQILARGVMH